MDEPAIALPRTDNQITAFGQALLIVGDQWSMLTIREALAGVRRFNEFKSRLGVSDAVLSRRLADLTDAGLFATEQYSDRPPRVEYVLTDKGTAIWPVFVAIWNWEARWARDTGPRPKLIHTACQRSVTPMLGCGSCGSVGITSRDTQAIRRPDSSINQSSPPRPYRKSSIRPSATSTHLHPELLDLLGDRWSLAVLGGAMLGLRRFGELQTELGISPILLSERLTDFVESDVFTKVPIADGARRQEYRLRPKGRDLMPVFTTTNDWANAWFDEPDGPSLRILHRACGELLDATWICNGCGDPLERDTVDYSLS